MNKTLEKQIITRYQNGESINAIRKDLNLSFRTVRKVLAEKDIHIANIQTLTTFHKRRAKNIYDSWVAGQTLSEIGDFYGVTYRRIQQIICQFCEMNRVDFQSAKAANKANRMLIKYHQNPTPYRYKVAVEKAAIIGKKVKKVG